MLWKKKERENVVIYKLFFICGLLVSLRFISFYKCCRILTEMASMKVVLFTLVLRFSWAQLQNSRQARILKYKFINDGTGPYYFTFATSDGITRFEESEIKSIGPEKFLVVKGEYSYTAPNGAVITVQYTADEKGFHPQTQLTSSRTNNNAKNNFISTLPPPQTYPTTYRPKVTINAQYITKTPKPFSVDLFEDTKDTISDGEQPTSTTKPIKPLTSYPHDYLISSSKIVAKKLKSKRASATDINAMKYF